MAIFTFPNHSFDTEYPQSGFQATLGNSYQYSAPPSAPDQRKFSLSFAAMKWFLKPNPEYNPNAIAIGVPKEIYDLKDGVNDPQNERDTNLGRLTLFYEKHKTHATFYYDHPVFGRLPCRFSEPLKLPKASPGSDGVVGPIELKLIECPGMTETFVGWTV